MNKQTFLNIISCIFTRHDWDLVYYFKVGLSDAAKEKCSRCGTVRRIYVNRKGRRRLLFSKAPRIFPVL